MMMRYKYDFKRMDIKHRLYYTNRNELGLSLEEGDERITQFRLATSVRYNIKKWKLDPKFSTELFWRGETDETTTVDKIRFKLGSTIDFKKKGELDFYYGIEHEFGERGANYYLIGLNYQFDLKLKGIKR
jgi:hypothetical protein